MTWAGGGCGAAVRQGGLRLAWVPDRATWGVWGATTGQPSRRRGKARHGQCRAGLEGRGTDAT